MLKSYKKFGLLAAMLVLVGGCASTQDEVYYNTQAIDDPFESVNRAVFDFNEAVDGAIIHPALKGYRAVVPKPARTGLDNFLNNLQSPIYFANEILQGDFDDAGTVFVRASANTFTGFGGLLDVAAYEGITHESEDFGQTLATWGVGHGPYVVVPLIGPSSTRDYIGFMVDGFADPLRWYLFNIDEDHIYYTRTGLDYLNLRNNLMDLLEELQKSSIDYYAATRSIYVQRRDAMVNDEDPDANMGPAIPDYDDF